MSNDRSIPVDDVWIPCADRLPEDGQRVIFCHRDGRKFIGTYTVDDENCDFLDECIIYWVPLPVLSAEKDPEQ